MTSGSTQAAVEVGSRQAHGWGVPPLCTQLRTSPQPSHGAGGAQLLPVPVWAPQVPPPTCSFPHLRTQPVQQARRRGRPGGCSSPHQMSWKDTWKNIKSLWSWRRITRLGGLSPWLAGFRCLKKLRCWLDPRIGGGGDTGLGENNTSVCRVLPPGEACQPPGVGWGRPSSHPFLR